MATSLWLSGSTPLNSSGRGLMVEACLPRGSWWTTVRNKMLDSLRGIGGACRGRRAQLAASLSPHPHPPLCTDGSQTQGLTHRGGAGELGVQ